MSDLGAVTGNILPAVSRASVRPCCHMDLCRWCQPAYITYIGRTGLERILLIEWCKECIHCMTILLLHLFYCFSCRLIVFGCHSRNCAVVISCCQRIRIFIFFFGILRNTKLLKVFIKNTLQRKVTYRVCQTVNKFFLKSCLRHKSRTFGNLVHTFLKLHSFCHMIGTHHI